MAETYDNRKPLFQVRVDPEVREKFEALHRRAQGQVPHQALTRAAVFDMIVSSGSAALDAGQLPLPPQPPRDG